MAAAIAIHDTDAMITMTLAGKGRAVLVGAVLVTAAATGCSSGDAKAPSAGDQPGRSSAAGPHRAAVVNDEIRLTCDQQLPGGLDAATLPHSAGRLHLEGENWYGPHIGDPVPAFTPTLRSANGLAYEAIQTRTIVDPQAAPFTTITVDSHDNDALLFYTDAATWGTDGKQLTAEQILNNSAHKVTLQNCGSHRTAYAGMLLVTHPGCFILGITATGDPGARTGGIAVAANKEAC